MMCKPLEAFIDGKGLPKKLQSAILPQGVAHEPRRTRAAPVPRRYAPGYVRQKLLALAIAILLAAMWAAFTR